MKSLFKSKRSILKPTRFFFIILSIFLAFTNNAPLFSSLNNNEEKIEKLLQNNNYLLGPGDVIQINFIDVKELDASFRISPDGTISLPLAGSVFLEDLTVDKARETIELKMSDHLLIPQINLQVITYRPIRISLIGEVQQPGIYVLESKGKFSKVSTLVDAIKEAGGLTNTSDIKQIRLVRKYYSNNELSLKEAYFNLWDLINEGKQENNPILFDGDSIFIKKIANYTEESSEFAFANLTPLFIKVKVIGAVKVPGIIELAPNTPLSQAVYSTGGPIEYNGQNKAQLIRLNKDGSVTNNKYKIKKELSVSEEYNPILKNNDIIYVPPTALARTTGALKTVVSPLSNLISILTAIKFIEGN